MIALWIFLSIVGLAIALVASGPAVNYTRALAASLGAPPFIVGVALVSLGTDLPELATAVVSHLRDDADVSVSTAVGSALTQYTFVVGLFPIVIAVIAVARREVIPVSALTILGLAITTAFVADGFLERWEGVVLIVYWAVALLIVRREAPDREPEEPPKVRYPGKFAQVLMIVLGLAIVGFGATLAVESIVRVAEDLGVPEFLLGFFGASVGTSAPELVVDLTALARGAPGIAFGDAFGSSLVDSTLTVGLGAVVRPAEVTARLAVTGAVYSIAAVTIVATALAWRKRHDRMSGALFIVVYAIAYVVLISVGAGEAE